MQVVRPRHGGAPGWHFPGGAGRASGGLIHRLISALLLAFAAPFAAAQSFAELASDSGPSRHERLVEAARKEGSLTVYTSNAAPTIEALSADFEKRYGVRVNAWRASSAKVLQRLTVEKSANRWDFDAVSISSPELEARNGLSVRGGNSVLANMVVSGEVPLALAVYSHMIEQVKQQGAPVDWFAIDPMIARSNGVGVSRKPPHPNAALLFYEYAIGDAQPLMVEMNYLSPLRKLASPLRGARIVFVDPAADRAEAERCDNAYDALIKMKK